ncbi:hypothetical protein ONV78_05020 [Hahella sp. CR1]|uniref:hypothetical protein n=1 Tax=Hahella sp. CR1 TaxID=2992807 RepID=UPI002441390A|nr:hypothetical protein [Hahella sp. CR1]MDG9667090.1 hypothetical protein [Hahella sp. CR1]
MDYIYIVIGLGIIGWITIGSPLLMIHQRRVVNIFFDKPSLYAMAELSFDKGAWEKCKARIHIGSISVPITTIWKGMCSPIVSKFNEIGYIGSAFSFAAFMLSVIFLGKYFQGRDFFIVLGIIFIIVFSVSWFLYNFRPFSAKSAQLCAQAGLSLEYIKEIGWEKYDEKMIDVIKEEVKLDLDIYKRETGVGKFVIVSLASALLFYARVHEDLSVGFIVVLTFLFLSIFVSTWLYEAYRSRVIEIAFETIIMLKKEKVISVGNVDRKSDSSALEQKRKCIESS